MSLSVAGIPLEDFQLGANLLNPRFIDRHILLDVGQRFQNALGGLSVGNIGEKLLDVD